MSTEDELTGAAVVGVGGLARCPWAAASPILRDYHDLECGRPVHGETALLEGLVLEGFQQQLS